MQEALLEEYQAAHPDAVFTPGIAYQWTEHGKNRFDIALVNFATGEPCGHVTAHYLTSARSRFEVWHDDSDVARELWERLRREMVNNGFGVGDPDATEPTAPGETKSGGYGPHGDTMGRVRSARELVENEHLTKTEACKRAHTDTRTYDRYVEDVIDWSIEEDE